MRRLPSVLLLSLTLLPAAACTGPDARDGQNPGGSPADQGDEGTCGDDDPIIIGRQAPPSDDECLKIEGSEIGEVGLTLDVGGTIVTFTNWLEKEDSPGEYIGFTITAEGGAIVYRVKAGTSVYTGSELSWIHPGGTSGPDAKGISNVQICEGDDDGGPDVDNPGDSGDEGTGGDGTGGDGTGGDGDSGCPSDDGEDIIP